MINNNLMPGKWLVSENYPNKNPLIIEIKKISVITEITVTGISTAEEVLHCEFYEYDVESDKTESAGSADKTPGDIEYSIYSGEMIPNFDSMEAAVKFVKECNEPIDFDKIGRMVEDYCRKYPDSELVKNYLERKKQEEN